MSETRTFHLSVLGRTLEHLGVQMYKRRDMAIAELVANCWDAGANNAWITLPASPYDPENGVFIIEDDGEGMTDDSVQADYLVVGRNRRAEQKFGGVSLGASRTVMGRKGIGKLAGFGIANKIEVTTWRNGKSTSFVLDMTKLKLEDHEMKEVDIDGLVGEVPSDVKSAEHGTRIVLRGLKQKSPVESDRLEESIARRFSRTVQGLMNIYIDGSPVGAPNIDWAYQVPPIGEPDGEADLGDGRIVRYRYGFAKSPIQSKELRGFTILTNGKTAQAPPYFFEVEATATGQHGTKYLSGTIEADFLDQGVDDDSDLISTDRQEIDWESGDTSDLLEWGARLTRRALEVFRDYRKDETKRRVLEDEGIKARVMALDGTSRKRAEKILGSIGFIEADDEREIELASSLLSAFEYQQFHDVIDQIELVQDLPQQLELLLLSIESWKALESRAILEVIRGRISIIDKLYSMVANDAPETAPSAGEDNLHDLIAEFPWMLDPEWQILYEEKSIGRQLREWDENEAAGDLSVEERRQRYDFLALGDANQLIVIEIKRSAYAPTLDDIQRLIKYKANLERAEDRKIIPMLISSDNFSERIETIDEQPILRRSWAGVLARTRAYYEHFRAILEGDIENPLFAAKESELTAIRRVISEGAYRGERRSHGLGQQDDIRAILDNEGKHE